MDEITNGYGIDFRPIINVSMNDGDYSVLIALQGQPLTCSDMDDYPTSASSSGGIQ